MGLLRDGGDDVSRFVAVPIAVKHAIPLVVRWHAHSGPPQEHQAAIACRLVGASEPCGVAVVGEPVAQAWCGTGIGEVVRVATDGTEHAASWCYGAARRLLKAMGFRCWVSYTLEREAGTCLLAAGFQRIRPSAGGSWDRESRTRPQPLALFADLADLVVRPDEGPKVLWACGDLRLLTPAGRQADASRP